MDLSSMLNDGPAPERKALSQTPPETRKSAQFPVPPTSGANGLSPGHTSSQPTPIYGSPSAGAPLSRQTTGLTPLQTLSQAPPGAQYPFPQQPLQSPSVQQLPGQQYPTFGPYSAATPGARAPAHSYQYPQASPSQYQPHGIPSGMHAVQTSSLSPTPPSHHGHTPQAVRQSPLATISQGPLQHHPQYPYQHSQPSTPLGPPRLQHSRTSNLGYQDLQSPHHQRHSSGTSNGMIAGSPAQHHPSIGNLLDSPSAYNHQSPQLRRTSDYLSHVDRERSVSVSPKTKVLPRALSQVSRESSQAESYSARSSLQQQQSVASLAETPSHVIAHSQTPQSSVAHSQLSSAHSGASEVVQQLSMPGQTPYSASGLPALEHSLSQPNTQPQPAIQHQSQRLNMNHLLTPADSVTSMDGAADGAMPKQRKVQEPSLFMKPSPKPKKAAVAPPPPEQVVEDRSGAAESRAEVEDVKELEVPGASESKRSNKRPAEHEPAAEPPAKRGKARKYNERPAWARLHPKNPRYCAEEHGVNGASSTQSQSRAQAPSRTNGVANTHAAPRVQHHQALQQPNGGMHISKSYLPDSANPERPWSDEVPLDRDLLRTRRCLGLEKWERSIKWTAPMPEMLKQVIDWLYVQLNKMHDVPDNPDEVMIEIEAKIGQIVKPDTGERIRMPITSPTILDQSWATKDNIRFESQMELTEHKAMNGFLNISLLESRQGERQGRVAMTHKHPKQVDSFRPLSDVGFNALPPSVRRHAKKGDLRLRTTTDLSSGKVLDRIVKVKISDLHIFNPAGDYDCRITINLEANMNREDMQPFDDLSEDWSPGERASPDRHKDRMAYHHLVYEIDLTMVSVDKRTAKFELELEVEGKPLREQMRRMAQGEENAFADVVSGFLDNAHYLMRQRAVA